MSTLTTAQRKALPLPDFGDPDNRLFPIVDQDDVDSAAHLIGKAANPEKVKTRIIAIAKRKGLKIPAAWQDAKMSGGDAVPVRFDLKASSRLVEGAYAVYPNSLVWVAGNYPDKQYAMTPEENWLAVNSFTPVSGNIEHTDFLAGRACHVRSIRIDPEDSARIRAEVAVPLALDTLMEPRERGLSCEWHRATKQLDGLALTTNPRISEAALMSNRDVAAFASASAGLPDGVHTTGTGQRTIQTMHDLAAKGGALCDQHNPNGTQRYSSSYFVSSVERDGLQAIHDTCVASGATCEDMGKAANYSAAFTALFAGSRHSTADAADIQAIHDLASKQGASCPPGTITGATARGTGMIPTPQYRTGSPLARRAGMSMTGGRPMAGGGFFAKWFHQGKEGRDLARSAGAELPDESEFSVIEDVAERVADEAARQTTDEIRGELAAEQARLTADRAEMARERFRLNAERAQLAAEAAADKLIVANKMLPAARDAFLALYTAAALDDIEHGSVAFNGQPSASRVSILLAAYEAQPVHSLTGQKLTGNFSVVRAATGGDAADDEHQARARRDALLAKTPQGRALLAKRNKSA